MVNDSYVIGIDYGTDSVRAIIANAFNGNEVAASVFQYPRWKDRLYCDASKNQFRQHPSDYIEGLEAVVQGCLEQVNQKIKEGIKAISVATTGSTPVAVNRRGVPLACLEAFEENPNAMFILWKDHAAAMEAEDINLKAKYFDNNYLKFVGGSYSSEWYWAKLLHILRKDKKVREQTYTLVEHSDWIPFLLTGRDEAGKLKRNVCAAGHKALWAEEYEGLPPVEFFNAIDPLLGKYVQRFGNTVYPANVSAGYLSAEWAGRLGLSTNVKVGIGALDAHMGAVGSEIKPYFMSKVIGTSTCDMMVVPKAEMKGKVIEGISGQVPDSIIPGMVGMEAGQSAFGDIYSWFKDLLLWSFLFVHEEEGEDSFEKKIIKFKEGLLKELDRSASELPVEDHREFALDWFNGRRTPDVDPTVTGLIGGLTLGSTPSGIYNALVEATCFGSRAIIHCIEKQGIKIRGVNAVGGIANKSRFVIQKLADVLNRPVHVVATDQPVALGAAMFASVVCGMHATIEAAVSQMGKGEKMIITPQEKHIYFYDNRYKRYERYGNMQR